MKEAVIGMAVLAIVIIALFCTVIIGAGEVGVKFDMFRGGVQEEEFTEGFNLKAPWINVDTYTVKTQEISEHIRTVTNEGLYIDAEITLLYRVVPTEADNIRRTIGKDGQYQPIVISPLIRNVARQIAAEHAAMDFYGDKRVMIENEMLRGIQDELDKRDIIVENLLLRDVVLPAELTKSIEAKKTAEQEALRMEYILQKEEQEKQRRIIEARGIAEANNIIAGSLSQAYLTWYWIDNLESHNSVLYVPVGDAGMPLFKNVDEYGK